jgi:hypothetical protein
MDNFRFDVNKKLIAGKEGDEVVDRTKILVDGKEVEVERILKDGTNYVCLRDLAGALGCTVDYDSVRKLPVVKLK